MAKHEQAYERLGAKVRSLPDVIAQSMGFMDPVFSSALVIPLVVGVISASGKGGGRARDRLPRHDSLSDLTNSAA
jgi:hypothetical protein